MSDLPPQKQSHFCDVFQTNWLRYTWALES
jgi:hypothetical protein